MSAVGKVFGGIKDAIFGGDTKVKQGDLYQPMSQPESNRLSDIESKINDLFGQQTAQGGAAYTQSADIQNMFANSLKSFLAKGGQQTPEDIQNASNFVDQTFTNPAQNQLKQTLTDLQSNYAANAASMGRDPNADIASNQAFAADATKAGLGLQAERGNRIQQASNDNFNRGLATLNSGMQGSNFLNNLGQQAFSNRLNLLNGQTGLADFYQRERGKTGAQFGTSPGLLGTVSGAAGQVAGTVGNIGKAVGGIGALL